MTHPIKCQVNPRNFNDYNNLFGKNGPVEIPKEVLEVYASNTGPNYSIPANLFNDWIDERIPDQLRRCMIRDIVHQTHSHTHPFDHDNYSAYYITPDDVHTILITGAGSIKQLRHLLRTRPKLLQELTEEFLYALDYEITLYHRLKDHHRISYDIVIEIILSATTDETIGRQLWEHHTAKSLTSDPNVYKLQPYDFLPLVVDAAEMPPWLHDSLMDQLAKYLDHVKTHASKEDLVKLPTNLINGANRYFTNRLQSTVQKFNQLYDKNLLTDRDLCELLRLFETHLPISGAYLHQEFVIKVLPTLTDESMAQCCARRHIKAWSIESCESTKYPKTILGALKAPSGRAFLYWLLGATYYYNPSDRSTIQTIKNLIATTKTLS